MYQERYGAYEIIQDDRGLVAVIRVPMGLFLPGGGMEGPEDYTECLHREMREETGYRAEIGEPVGRAGHYGESKRVGGPLHTVACFYRARLAAKVSEPTEADHELTWITPVQAARDLYLPHQRWALAKAFGLETEDQHG